MLSIARPPTKRVAGLLMLVESVAGTALAIEESEARSPDLTSDRICDSVGCHSTEPASTSGATRLSCCELYTYRLKKHPVTETRSTTSADTGNSDGKLGVMTTVGMC